MDKYVKILKGWRERRGLTQAEAVVVMNRAQVLPRGRQLSLRTWQDWECGRRGAGSLYLELVLEKIQIGVVKAAKGRRS